ncbi:MAG TPA: nitrile hydratase subunit beta [Roseiarcus sp.]|nr:nitrile hydratase subunit beta [Roseiarcus sp.]
MIGGQDLGGVMGFGPIVAEPQEPVFHAEWERRAFALTLAAGALGQWGIDASRHAREARSPGEYLSSSYYALWLKGLERLLVASGLVSNEEIMAGRALTAPKATRPMLRASDVGPALAKGTRYDRPIGASPRFQPGALVRTKLRYTTGHTRLPRYAFGKRGVVEKTRGAFVLPDSAAAGRGEAPEPLYTVRFTGRELWGDESDDNIAVSIDAWESYLDPA